MPLTLCEECGFKCEELQLKKTKGKCPRCYKDEADAYLVRTKQRITR